MAGNCVLACTFPFFSYEKIGKSQGTVTLNCQSSACGRHGARRGGGRGYLANERVRTNGGGDQETARRGTCIWRSVVTKRSIPRGKGLPYRFRLDRQGGRNEVPLWPLERCEIAGGSSVLGERISIKAEHDPFMLGQLFSE